MSTRRIYLDHSATTPLDERVFQAMQPYFSEIYGNPSSVHQFGQEAEAAIEQARQDIATIFHCQPQEIIFTSGGSESDNLAIRGAAFAARQNHKGNHIVTQALEHSAVGRTFKQLEEVFGFEVSYVPIDKEGRVTPYALRSVMRDDTVLVSIMYANNEIGTINPITELAAVAHEYGAIFHTDAVQAAGQLDLNVSHLGIDLMSISGHKFYGPKGIGALYVRHDTPIIPIQTGGSHEFGLRSGTHNVPSIVGMAKALQFAYQEREKHIEHYQLLRDRLIDGILNTIEDVRLTGSRTERLPSHASFVFKHIDANNMLMALDAKGIAASSGSACKTGNPEPSGVILALGYDLEWAMGSLRLSVGRQTTLEDIDYTLEILPQVVTVGRKLWTPIA
ncbi:MAG: cysteine desulfurase NifS [Phototrophicales bacterium]|nr:MAG: cysteine desulfurase NifS [Phototrophicales bacterium]